MGIRGMDIISEHRLDNAPFINALKASDKTARDFGNRLNTGLTRNIAQTRQSFLLLEQAMYLVGSTELLVALNAAQVATGFIRLASAAGVATTAIAALWAVIAGPVGIIVALVAAATAIGVLGATWAVNWLTMSSEAEKATTFIDKMADKLHQSNLDRAKREQAAYDATQQSLQDWRASRMGPGADLAPKDTSALDAEIQIRLGNAVHSDFEQDPEVRGRMIVLEELDKAEKAREEGLRAFTEFWEASDDAYRQHRDKQIARQNRIDDMARDTAIRFGLAQPSAFESDPRLRSLMRLGERNTSEQSIVTPGFGISSRLSSQFAGRRSGDQSVIGEQRTERVERKVDTLIELLKKDVAANEDVARVIAGGIE